MESPEEAVVASYSCNSSTGGDTGGDGSGGRGGDGDCHHVAAAALVRRRRRTKRLRLSDPSGSRIHGGAEEEEEEVGYSSSAGTATEEEDMAHCLILLAQGDRRRDVPEEKFVSRRFAETTTTAGGKAGYYVYECKTCNKCFPSFQALGGHRASHKKPKLADDHDGLDVVGTAVFPRPSAHALGNKFRVHECSICGLEFASGQALGGHMRRHRPVGPVVPGPAVEEAVKKEKSVALSLDLNLPAPTEESGSSMPVVFGFADRRPVALVDCHY